MRRTWKRIRMIALMLCCALLVNAVSFTAYATEGTENTSVNVIFNANGGELKVTRNGYEQEGPYESWGDMYAVGSTVAASASVDSVTYWHPDRELSGWMLCTEQQMTDPNGGTYIQNVQLPGTGIFTTEEALSYVIPEGYTRLIFVAQWAGSDDDYYREVSIQGYGVPFTYNQTFWMNNETVTNEVNGDHWGSRLKCDGTSIATQTADFFEFVAEPVKENAEFQGWAEFKVVKVTNEVGNLMNVYELVSDTLYTTEQMLDRQIPDYDVAYVAKWSDIALDVYFNENSGGNNGPMGYIELELSGGTITAQTPDGTIVSRHYRANAPVGGSLNDVGVSFADPVYWNPDRAFVGWMLCTWEEVDNGNGIIYWDYVQVPETGLFTTADVLAYEVTEGDTIFVAQWAGDDNQYYTQVEIDGYGAMFVFTDYCWEFDEKIGTDKETGRWGNRLKIWTDGIATQTADYFEFKSEPAKEGADFEGWAEFKMIHTADNNGMNIVVYELVSDTIYTTEQMLSRPVPAYNVCYTAKWSDIALENYYGNSGPNVGDQSWIGLDANDGMMTIDFGDSVIQTGNNGFCIGVGMSLEMAGITVTDPVFWDEDRAFLGWQLCTKYEESGPDYHHVEFIPVPGMDLFTTEELMSYEATPVESYFIAQWEGEDYEYYSQVDIDGYGSMFTFTEKVWNNNEQELRDREIERWGNRLRKNGEGIATQIVDNFVFKAEPTKEGADFEGWAEFRQVYMAGEDGGIFTVYELVSDTIYTTEQMLSRPIPDYNVCYAAKWSDIALENYYNGSAGGGDSAVWGNYTLFGGTGDITFSWPMEDGGTNTEAMGTYQFMLGNGQSLNDYLTEHQYTYGGIRKACSELVGWQVFTYDSAEWYEIPAGEELAIGDPDIWIEPAGTIWHQDGTANDRYIIMTFCEKYQNLLTTEEAFALGGDGKNYFVTAVWSTKHKEGPEVRQDVSVTNGQGTYLSLIYCEECGTLLKSWERTFTVESQEVTIPDFDEPARVDISSRVMDIPEEIREEFEHVDDIKDAMINSTVAVDENISAKNIKTSFMDVELKVQNGSGDWETVTHENFPEEGISILIPYPAGTNADTEGFVVSHMISAGEEAGTIEILVYTKEEGGLRITVTSLSPIMVAYAQENPFGDIKESDWYYSYAMFAFNHALMGGKGAMADGSAKFDPSNNMTRAEFVQSLYSKEGKPEVEYQDTFTDVPEGTWFTNAVIWANQNGLVAGKGDKFDVNGNITRQEMALILRQYAALKGYDTSANASLASFADSAKVSSWAATGMQWAVSHNVIGGTANNELLPLNQATRAEAATMIRGFMIELEGVEE